MDGDQQDVGSDAEAMDGEKRQLFEVEIDEYYILPGKVVHRVKFNIIVDGNEFFVLLSDSI